MEFLFPKKDQTANRKVANNFSGFKNLNIIHCNGKDVFDSMNAMYEAKKICIGNRNAGNGSGKLYPNSFSFEF